MIRPFRNGDLATAQEIHRANELPENCFPNLYIENEEKQTIPNPLYMIKAVCETPDGKPAMMAFVQLTSEAYILIDHSIGTPKERWEWLQEMTEYAAKEAWKNGLEQITIWVPQEIEKSFKKRLLALRFVKSPWQSYTLNLNDCLFDQKQG